MFCWRRKNSFTNSRRRKHHHDASSQFVGSLPGMSSLLWNCVCQFGMIKLFSWLIFRLRRPHALPHSHTHVSQTNVHFGACVCALERLLLICLGSKTVPTLLSKDGYPVKLPFSSLNKFISRPEKNKINDIEPLFPRLPWGSEIHVITLAKSKYTHKHTACFPFLHFCISMLYKTSKLSISRRPAHSRFLYCAITNTGAASPAGRNWKTKKATGPKTQSKRMYKNVKEIVSIFFHPPPPPFPQPLLHREKESANEREGYGKLLKTESFSE